jgi:hypothetical protein
MGTWVVGPYKRLKLLAFAGLVVLTLTLQIIATDDPQSGDDGGNSEDTDFARTTISRTQI